MKLLNLHIITPKESDHTVNGYLDRCLKIVKNQNGIGFAGFDSKENLKKHLRKYIKGKSGALGKKEINFDKLKTDLEKIHKKTLAKIGLKKKHDVFVFVSHNSKFSEKEFGGVGGYSPWRGTIHLYIDKNGYKDEALVQAFTHEFNHSNYFYKKVPETILDQMIFEGLAENFTEKITGSCGAWTRVFTKSEVKEVLQNLTPVIDSRDHSMSHDIFFGSKKFKKWAGYSIGYWLVKNFIERNKSMSWKKLFNIKSDVFLLHFKEKSH